MMKPCPTHGTEQLDQLTNICSCGWKPKPPRKRKPKVKPPDSQASSMRRFILRRLADESGISGTGVVAEGIRFSNGQAVLHWLTQLSSVAVYHSVDVIVSVHGHDGKTVLEWVDADPIAAVPSEPGANG